MLKDWSLKSKSPHLAYLLMAITISLVCNFSYLILLVSNQSDSNLRANGKRNRNNKSPLSDNHTTPNKRPLKQRVVGS